MAKRKPPRGRRAGRGTLAGGPAGHAGGHIGGHAGAHAAAHRPSPARARQRPAAGGSTLWLYGQHAVAAALANPQRRCLRLAATDIKAAEVLLDALPNERRPPVEPADRAEIDALLPPGAVHQGLALLVAPLPEQSVGDICDATRDTADARVIVLDQVTDPQNVGAVLRSAAAFGAAAVIVQDRHAPPVTGTLARAASGALEQVALVRAVNLNRALGELKDAGFWAVGLAGEAEQPLAAIRAANSTDSKCALVLGAEGAGLRRLTREACDMLVRIPIADTVESLNISNAAAVALYELTRKTT